MFFQTYIKMDDLPYYAMDYLREGFYFIRLGFSTIIGQSSFSLFLCAFTQAKGLAHYTASVFFYLCLTFAVLLSAVSFRCISSLPSTFLPGSSQKQSLL